MFEDPAFDCTAAEFAQFMKLLADAFAKEWNADMKDSRSSWLAQFEEWLETDEARDAMRGYFEEFKRTHL
jgi:hypothetical protein